MKTQFASLSKIALGAIALFALASSVQAESLWPANQTKSMFASTVANQRGDILTVVIDESTSFSQDIDFETEKESSLNNTITQWLFTPANSGFGTHNGETPSTQMSGERAYETEAELSSNQRLTGRIQVMVSQALPNGNLVIQGARKVTYSGETTFIVLSGIVRGVDISGNNSITSSLIYDARIEVIGEGRLEDSKEKGWLEKLNDIVNPF